jgi:hypothetical protein
MMQFDTSSLANILIAVFGSGGLLALLARIWLKRHGLDNGAIPEMKHSVKRTEEKLDKLSTELGLIKISLAKTDGKMSGVARDVVGEHETRYHPRGIR